jgi:uncharacterized protein YndB with AHSA1/START domain
MHVMALRQRGYAHRTDILADVQVVWRALTETSNLTRWCSPDAWIRAKQDRVTQLEAHIDVFEPARRLRLIYLPCEALPAGEATVSDDFMISSLSQGTIVRLIGSGFEDSEAGDLQYRRLRAGWKSAMARLKVFAEQLAKEVP